MGHSSDGNLKGERRCSRGTGRSCVSTELARALHRQGCTDKVCSHLLYRCKTEDFSTSGHSIFLASNCCGGGEHWDDNSWQLVYLQHPPTSQNPKLESMSAYLSQGSSLQKPNSYSRVACRFCKQHPLSEEGFSVSTKAKGARKD